MARLDSGTLKDMNLKNNGLATKENRHVHNDHSSPSKLSEITSLVDAERTTGNGWHLRATSYPTGDVEIIAVKLGHEDNLKRGGGAKRKATNVSQMDIETLRKSRARSKRVVLQRCLTLQADTLLTLTYRENMTDLDRAWKDFRKFSKLMKRWYGKKWCYVCVPERQQRGAIHFHLAIRGHYHWNTVRRIWREVIGQGNVDFQRKKGKHGYITDPRKIARYLAKYLTKQQTTEFNKRRYSSSRIVLPEPTHGWLPLGVPLVGVMRQLVKGLSRFPIMSYWENESGYIPIAIMRT